MRRETRRSRIAAVILAAGGSTRFGSPKQLLVHDGQALVRCAALAAQNAGLDPVIIVLGANATLVAPVLSGLESVTMVMNDDWQTGQASSLRIGLQSAQAEQPDAVLVMLADQPLVDAPALDKILSKFDSEHRIVASEYDGTIGAPAVFGCEYLEDLMTLTGDTGAGKWLRRHIADVTQVALPEATLDIDTIADTEALKQER